MAELLDTLDRKAIRQTALELAGLLMAAALLLSFGAALVHGLTHPGIGGADVTAAVRRFMTGPVYTWGLRAVVALLALLEGWLTARRLAPRDESPLPEVFSATFASLLVVIVVRLALDLLFSVTVTAGRLLFDALMYVAALGLALLGAERGPGITTPAPGNPPPVEDAENDDQDAG